MASTMSVEEKTPLERSLYSPSSMVPSPSAMLEPSSVLPYKRRPASVSKEPTSAQKAVVQLTSAGKRKKLFERSRPLIKLAFFLNCICIFVMFSISLGKLMEYNLTPTSKWKMLKQPTTVQFDEFLLTSTSETCNEYARELYMDSRDISVIAVAMAVCLSIAEPHNSGIGGHSIAVRLDAKSGSCQQTLGYYQTPSSLEELRKSIEREPGTEHIGPLAVAIPGTAQTLRGLMEMAGSSKNDDKFQKFFRRLHENMKRENDTFPVGKSLHNSLHASNLDLQISLRPHYKYLLNKELSTLIEGAAFSAEEAFTNFEKVVADKFEGLTSIGLHELDGETDSVGANVVQEWKLKQEQKGNIVLPGKITNIGSYQACTASEPISASFVARTLSELRMNSTSNPMTSKENYLEISKKILRIYEMAVDDMEQHTDKKTKKMFRRFQKRRDNDEAFVSYGANMFAVVDLEKQIAVAMTASMGSSFGAMVADPEKQYTLNNLMAFFGRYYDVMGNNHYIMQPIIIMKDKKIEIVYAGSGGFLTRALDLARTVTALAFSLLGGVPLENAITSPLFYPMPEHMEYTEGIPWARATWLTSQNFVSSRATAKEKEESNNPALQKIDRAVAIQVRKGTAYGFYFDVGGQQMMPMGV